MRGRECVDQFPDRSPIREHDSLLSILNSLFRFLGNSMKKRRRDEGFSCRACLKNPLKLHNSRGGERFAADCTIHTSVARFANLLNGLGLTRTSSGRPPAPLPLFSVTLWARRSVWSARTTARSRRITPINHSARRPSAAGPTAIRTSSPAAKRRDGIVLLSCSILQPELKHARLVLFASLLQVSDFRRAGSKVSD
jgi:hypothetical protein